jgi:hypothetical protein
MAHTFFCLARAIPAAQTFSILQQSPESELLQSLEDLRLIESHA